METIPYAYVIGSLMYAQTCTRLAISFVVGMLTYKRFDHLEVMRYTDSDFNGCVDTRKSTFGYVHLIAE